MQENDRAMLLTALYSDIFNYPLTLEELKFFSIGKKITIKNSKNIQSPLVFYNGYICLKGKEKTITERKKREIISKKKLQIAEKITKILSYIPTIELIGLSGSLAVAHAKKEDDIDLFIITKESTLWITRAIVVVVLKLLGYRREREAHIYEDKICANMFMDKRSLSLPKNLQNLFTAHEVIQMKPLFVRNNTYDLFLQYNMWTRDYLPNSNTLKKKNQQKKQKVFILLRIFEIMAKYVQLEYMKKHITKEIVSDTLLAFHPRDQSTYILDQYDKRRKKYHV